MSFTVTVQPSGRNFQVARDEPILSAAIREGADGAVVKAVIDKLTA